MQHTPDPRSDSARSGARSLAAARIVGRESMPGGLVRVGLEVPPEVRATYTNPGQYVTIRLENHESSFVLASDPGDAVWDVIVRPTGQVASALATTDVDQLEISGALGAGFPLHSVGGRALVIAVVGSGIAAGRPVIRARIEAGDAPNTRLYLGVRRKIDIPLASEIDSWVARGCRVVACLSRDTGDGGVDQARLRLASGYVQHSLGRDLRAAPAVSIFVAGSKAMVDAVRDVASDLSMDRRDVVTNH